MYQSLRKAGVTWQNMCIITIGQVLPWTGRMVMRQNTIRSYPVSKILDAHKTHDEVRRCVMLLLERILGSTVCFAVCLARGIGGCALHTLSSPSVPYQVDLHELAGVPRSPAIVFVGLGFSHLVSKAEEWTNQTHKFRSNSLRI